MKKRGDLHEAFDRLEHPLPSEASFGYSFAFVCAVIAVIRLSQRHVDGVVFLPIAVALISVVRLKPSILRGPNEIWFKFSVFLFRVVSPVMMAVVYFLVITPVGVVARMTGRKFLALEKEPNARTYWSRVDPEKKSSFENQF